MLVEKVRYLQVDLMEGQWEVQAALLAVLAEEERLIFGL